MREQRDFLQLLLTHLFAVQPDNLIGERFEVWTFVEMVLNTVENKWYGARENATILASPWGVLKNMTFGLAFWFILYFIYIIY